MPANQVSNGTQYTHTVKKIFICYYEIKVVTCTKFMGAIIDQSLTWEKHIFHVKKTVAKGLGIICKVNKFLNFTTLQTILDEYIVSGIS